MKIVNKPPSRRSLGGGVKSREDKCEHNKQEHVEYGQKMNDSYVDKKNIDVRP